MSGTQFDLNALKNKSLTTQKKVDTVIVKKKGSSSIVSFFGLVNKVGLSFIFERIIPHSWKKIFGLRRALLISILTRITAFINIGLSGYFLFCNYPFLFRKPSFFSFQDNLSKPLGQPDQITVQKPIVEPVVLVPSAPEPVTVVPIPPQEKPLGEFE